MKRDVQAGHNVIELKGKTIVITGASSGIGAATARACAEAGMNVVLNARRAERLAGMKEEIERAGGGAEVVAGDVTAPGTSEEMLRAARERFGGYYAVFANAGYGQRQRVDGVKMEDLKRMFEVNLYAGVELVGMAAREMMEEQKKGTRTRERGAGHLMMCSSILARFATKGAGVYCATKAAQRQMCRAMRMELRGTGIFVTSVHPIGTETEFFETSVKLAEGSAGAMGEGTGRPPRMFMQKPERVARGVVRCLRRPRAEVWTTVVLRGLAGVIDLIPATADRVIGRWG